MSDFNNFINNNTDSSRYFITPSADNKAPEEVKNTHTPAAASDTKTPSAVSTPIRDEFVKEKKNNGIVGKFYNFLKNKTGFGLGTKRVEAEIDKFEKGQITEEQAREKISQYKISRENAVQSTGDLITAAITIPTYFLANNQIKKLRARYELGAIPNWLQIKDELKEAHVKESRRIRYLKKFENIVKSKGKTTAVLLPVLAILGGITKLTYGKFERIGSKEYKADKNLPRKERIEQKKALRKERRKTNLRNFLTGAADGMLAPVVGLVGGIAGVPAYLAATMGLRYASSKNDGKEKSFGDFTKSLKDNAAFNTVIAAAIAIPAFKHANYSKVLSENLDKVVAKLKGKQLHLPDLPSHESAYQELENRLINSEAIQTILKKYNSFENPASMDEIITQLTEENIFAVKFLQIKNGGMMTELAGKEGNAYRAISEALRESCPATRSIEEAQQHINELWGSSEYTISKLLGVGTVAETYLAKDKSGKEVCIKVLKKGITAEKIAQDKQKFIELITNGKSAAELTEDEKYLVRNIEDLANGISKEVDFKNEMEAAKKLVKHCKVANVVKPIAAKDGIYVMERAPGISVKTLVDYYNCEQGLRWRRKLLDKNPEFGDQLRKEIAELEQKMEKIKSRSPEFADFDMTPQQIKRLLKNYIDLQVEQFSKLDKNGKVIHADIHPGNIFINLEALKSGKGKLFTLIDTGNVIEMSKEQTKAALRVIKFIKNGNYKDLSKIVLDGAILPKGMTEAEALSKVEADMKKFFFDSETKIESMNIDTFYALSDNILRKYSIIPNNTQLNLNKAKISARNSFNDLLESFFSKKYGHLDEETMSRAQLGTELTKALKDGAQIGTKMLSAQRWQETKNLLQMSFKEAWNFLRNGNMLKTNSEDYLTYEMKQAMPGPQHKIVLPEEL